MYDFAHGQSDFFEGVTHSLCTLEFVVHRPLYDLFIDWLKEGKDLNDNRPRQTEFNKLNLSYTLMSKRNLLTLVKEGLVNGWDDPRMPTICGFRRRGYSPESIHKFIDKSDIPHTMPERHRPVGRLRSGRPEQPCHPCIGSDQPG